METLIAATPDFSVVIPVYFNEGSLTKLVQIMQEQVISVFPDKQFEYVFVDDGSQDGSYRELQAIKVQSTVPVTLVKLARNFGQVPAMMAGYAHARGKAVINMSADLQDPPELICQMIRHHLDEHFHIVICTRESREEGYYRRVTSKLFYNLMKKLSFKNMPQGGFDFVLISGMVKDLILSNQEANPFWQGQILWPGFKVKWIPYRRNKREIGISRWTFSKKIKYLLDGVLAYSYVPIRMMSLIGVFVALAGFLYTIVIIINWALGNSPFTGWSPLMIVILLLSGLQMIMTGLIGEYVWRTLDQVKNRPLYVIERIEPPQI